MKNQVKHNEKRGRKRKKEKERRKINKDTGLRKRSRRRYGRVEKRKGAEELLPEGEKRSLE